MVDISIIKQIKSSCVTIGYRKKGDQYPREIHGTGFIIDPEGYAITAKHVIVGIKNKIDRCVTEELTNEGLVKDDLSGKEIELYSKRFDEVKKEYEITATLTEISEETITVKTAPILEHRSISVEVKDIEHYLPKIHDVSICRIFGEWGQLPHLKLKSPSKLDVFSDIFICGFPRGQGTFDPFNTVSGRRFSPIIQSGKIASLMPSDLTPRPFGLFTDIVGVGGSSGSPIIDAESNEVIAIAQSVTGAGVSGKLQQPIGTAAIGIVWGVTFYFLYGSILKMIEAMKTVTTKKGEPLLNEGDVIMISMTVGESLSSDEVKYKIVKKEDIPDHVEK